MYIYNNCLLEIYERNEEEAIFYSFENQNDHHKFQEINELIHDICTSKLQEDTKEEVAFIYSFEIKNAKQDFTPIKSTNP